MRLHFSWYRTSERLSLTDIEGLNHIFMNAIFRGAAHGDKERYFAHLTHDAVYLGTDEWERWPKYPDFDDYVNGRFKDGSGWTYKSVDRTIRSNNSSVLHRPTESAAISGPFNNWIRPLFLGF